MNEPFFFPFVSIRQPGKNYTATVVLAEDPSNTIYNNSVPCASSTGCLGATMLSASVDFVRDFCPTEYSPFGVDPSQLLLGSSCASSPLSSGSVSVSVSFSVDGAVSAAAFAVRLQLFGKPPKASNR